jgi:hypothetical protein
MYYVKELFIGVFQCVLFVTFLIFEFLEEEEPKFATLY